MQISIAFPVRGLALMPLLLLAACSHDTLPGGVAATAAAITVAGLPTAGLGDGEPCTPGADAGALGDLSLCAGEVCAPCDVAVFGATVCACADTEATPPTGCAAHVCLPLFDACHAAGWTWDPAAQSCTGG